MNRFMKFGVALSVALCSLISTPALASEVEVINKGVGGNSSTNMLARVDNDVVALAPDLVIMMVGTNDMLNSKKITSYEQYESNLIELIERIKASGEVDVMLMSSLPADSEYLAQRHDTTKYHGHPTVVMANVRKIVKKLARKYRCHFVDLHSEFTKRGLPQHNEDPYIRNNKNSNNNDGVHPTALGYALISDIIWDYFVSKKIQTSYNRIVCFGDSITRGSGAKAGEDYPSQLSRHLNSQIEAER